MYIVLHIQGQTIKVASFKYLRNLLLDNAEEWVDSKVQFFISVTLHKVLITMINVIQAKLEDFSAFDFKDNFSQGFQCHFSFLS